MTGEYLKEWMLRNGKSREEIAFRVGVTTNTLFRWFKLPEIPRKAVYTLERLGCVETYNTVSAKAVNGHNK